MHGLPTWRFAPFFLSLSSFFFLAMPLGLQYLNSLTRVQTWALGSENMES